MSRLRFGRILAALTLFVTATAVSAQSVQWPVLPGLTRRAEAVRFLNRATFGAAPSDVVQLLGQGKRAWLDAQFMAPPSLTFPEVSSLGCAPDLPGFDFLNCPGYSEVPFAIRRNEIWWRHALSAPDQLRQRVAFALSEIFVVSDRADLLGLLPCTVADYYDTLVVGAFGTYRDLLEDVTLHSAMGYYLSMAKNRKANPILGTRPDENYAREIMQLFSIGLEMLEPNGEPTLDFAGDTIPTYDQDVITNMARALTGWTYKPAIFQPSRSLAAFLFTWITFGPMEAWRAFHDIDAKLIVDSVPLPANQTPEDDLAQTLDALANHPNVGPFIGKQLIQRLVTSNPSPEYVARVSAVWANDGTGVRGNLGAVVRAILLDAEAEHGHRVSPRTFGKVREPLLRITGLFRTLEATGTNTTLFFSTDDALGQRAVGAPSVFNFFRPEYSTTALSAEGLVAPELQITTTSTITRTANLLTYLVREGNSTLTAPGFPDPVIDIEALRLLSAFPREFIGVLDVRLCGGTMSNHTRQILTDHISALPFMIPGWPFGYFRTVDAIALLAISPDYAIQR